MKKFLKIINMMNIKINLYMKIQFNLIKICNSNNQMRKIYNQNNKMLKQMIKLNQ